MKIKIIGDVHFGQYSSIVRSRGDLFSTRLENCIESINWALEEPCDLTIFAGDFFDKDELNAEELTALKCLHFPETTVFVVGNHEITTQDNLFNSVNAIKGHIVHEPTEITYDDFRLVYLPTIMEDNRKPLNEYISPSDKFTIIISHNDIKGINYGVTESKVGFTIDEIESNCDLYFNGHIHNGSKVTDKIINIGNLTGQNFSEDAFKYRHGYYMLDTYTMTDEIRENPYALNFYSIDFTDKQFSIPTDKYVVLSIKCYLEDVTYIKELLSKQNNVVAYKITIISTNNCTIDDTECPVTFTMDYYSKFADYVRTTFIDMNNTLLESELSIILGGM